MCVIVQNFIIIGQMVLEISRFFHFLNSHYLEFQIYKFLVDRQIGRPNMHHCTIFH